MLQVTCTGTPYEIGKTHGTSAKAHILRTIAFYEWQFLKRAKLDWTGVRNLASKFEEVIVANWPKYHEEIRGIADGAEIPIIDAIAINVRTEISFGSFSDGCTSLSWKSDTSSFLAQNWDWEEQQLPNLILLSIVPEKGPKIKMITEAGLIGKIGLNSSGVGVCLNALRARGMNPTQIPCHLGLRMVLESENRNDALSELQRYGLASACHMLIADATGGIGVEWSSTTCRVLDMNASKQVFHTNHYLAEHPGVEEVLLVEDSADRISRIQELCNADDGGPSFQKIRDAFKDEANYPVAICRAQTGSSFGATLFNIVMDLVDARAVVTLGRPVDPIEEVTLSF